MSEDLKHLIGKQFRTVGGVLRDDIFKAEIIKADLNHPKYPILAIITGTSGQQWAHAYTKDLKSSTHYSLDLVEVIPYEDFKMDDPVVCWDNHSPNKVNFGHFAEVSESGKALVFSSGRTSHTSDLKIRWDNCISKEEYETRLKQGTL